VLLPCAGRREERRWRGKARVLATVDTPTHRLPEAAPARWPLLECVRKRGGEGAVVDPGEGERKETGEGDEDRDGMGRERRESGG